DAAASSGTKIGTTRRGIGPAYEDKVGRRAIRVMDLADEASLPMKVDRLLTHHNALRRGLAIDEVDGDALLAQLLAVADAVLPYAENVSSLLDGERRAAGIGDPPRAARNLALGLASDFGLDQPVATQPVERGVDLADVERPDPRGALLELALETITVRGVLGEDGEKTVTDAQETLPLCRYSVCIPSKELSIRKNKGPGRRTLRGPRSDRDPHGGSRVGLNRSR
ncbi:MAG: hypothetical protein HC897_18740, partial [Thermoanaerobaculia bacterium]|nr:hypothetical protein [Thermoanaerobaculia bacterium]